MSQSETLAVGTVIFSGVNNRYEKKIVKALKELIDGKPEISLSEKDIRDIYALALNQLPAHYAQPGTIVLGDPYGQKAIYDIVLKAFDRIIANPKP